MEVRRLDRTELDRVTEIDVSEEGSVNYRIVGGDLVVFAKLHRRPPFSAESWRSELDVWEDMLDAGGLAFGALADGTLLGIAILRLRLTTDMAQFAGLYVDRSHRRTGVASALLNKVELHARQDGARTLYVSATPSDSAVPFYLHHGFVPVVEPHPDLFALEPGDIHMAKPL